MPKILTQIASLLQPSHFQSVVNFLVSVLCLDQNKEVVQASQEAALRYIYYRAAEYTTLNNELWVYIDDKKAR